MQIIKMFLMSSMLQVLWHAYANHFMSVIIVCIFLLYAVNLDDVSLFVDSLY